MRAASPFGEAKAVVDDFSALDSIPVELEQENLLEIPNTKIEKIGRMLYKTLFAGKIAELGQHVVQEGIRQKLPAQFEVRFDADQVMLAKFPWEMITHNVHIDVTVMDPQSGKTLSINLPSGVDTEHYMNSLLREMEMSDGAYVFYSKGAGGKIDLHQSLFKSGVKSGETLRLMSFEAKERDQKEE